MNKVNRIGVAALMCSTLLSGCAMTSTGTLGYTPPETFTKAVGSTPVIAGTFLGQRGEDPKWIGVIRGGFGYHVKELESDKPVSELVKRNFVDAMQARGIVTSGGGKYPLGGVVKKLHGDQFVKREATVEIEVSVTDNTNGSVRFSRVYVSNMLDDSSPLAAGMLAAAGWSGKSATFHSPNCSW